MKFRHSFLSLIHFLESLSMIQIIFTMKAKFLTILTERILPALSKNFERSS
jgi:hypothetical protein